MNIFIAVEHIFAYEASETNILGVYTEFTSARDIIIHDCFAKLTYNYYDPQKRFFKSDGQWRDYWLNSTGISDYHIEEWKPDIGLVQTQYFDFDAWLKTMIINEHKTSQELKLLLRTWRDEVFSNTIPPCLGELMRFSKGYVPDVNQETWIQTYGSIPPYPWSDNLESL